MLVQLHERNSQLKTLATSQWIQEQLKEKKDQTMSRLIWSQGSSIFDLLTCDNYDTFFYKFKYLCAPLLF